jgi:hypothetical protein
MYCFSGEQDESSLAAHLGERAPRSANDDPAATPAEAEAATGEVFEEVEPGSSSGEDEDDHQAPSSASPDDTTQQHDARSASENGVNGAASPPVGLDEETGRASSNGATGDVEMDESALEAFLDSAPDPLASSSRQGKAIAASFNRYGLDMQAPSNDAAAVSPEGDGEKEGGAPGREGARKGSRHVSAAERRLQKKVRIAPTPGPCFCLVPEERIGCCFCETLTVLR